ncbi:MAG: hypothetical protein ACXAC7_18355 [Candidatus Hodarchaeales archaeon]
MSDGGYLLVGYTESFGAYNRDIWLIKINEHSSSNGQISGFLIWILQLN